VAGGDECGNDPNGNQLIACWDAYDKTDFGSYWRLNRARIFVDRTQYPPLSSDWEIATIGHEWGHNLSLDHHTTTGPCTENSIMAYVYGDACLTRPSGSDVSSVHCRVYHFCTWHGFSSWGWPAELPPDGMATDYTRIDHTHMVRRSGCDLLEKYWNGNQWIGWYNRSGYFSGCINGSVANSLGSTGYGEYLAGTVNGDLYYSSNIGSSWTFLGRPAPSEPIDGPIAIAASGGSVHIVGVSKAPGLTTGTVYLKIYNPGTGWLAWQNLGGNDTIGGSLAIADRGGLIHVAGFTPVSAHVWLTYWNGQSWQGWEDLGGLFDGALAIDNANAVPRNPVLTPHVGVHISAYSGGYVMVRCWDSYCTPGWWDAQGGPGYVLPAALTNSYGELHIVSRYSSTELKHRERNP
jgi:hypothetical protein